MVHFRSPFLWQSPKGCIGYSAVNPDKNEWNFLGTERKNRCVGHLLFDFFGFLAACGIGSILT